MKTDGEEHSGWREQLVQRPWGRMGLLYLGNNKEAYVAGSSRGEVWGRGTVGVRSEVAQGWGHYKEYMKQGATKSFEWKTGLLGLRFLRDHDASVLRGERVR